MLLVSFQVVKEPLRALEVFLALQIMSANDCQGKIMINLVTTGKRFLNS